MRPPLLLPAPRSLRLLEGRFSISEKTRIYLTPGCGDGELEAARELAAAIERYAGRRVAVDRITTRAVPRDGVGLRFGSEPSAEEALWITAGADAAGPATRIPRRAAPPELPEAYCADADAQTAMGTPLHGGLHPDGFSHEDELYGAVAGEVGLEEVVLDEIVVTPELLRVIDVETVCKYHVFPVRFTGEELYVAMADPFFLEVLDELEAVLGVKVIGVAAPEHEILQAIDRYYGVTELKTLDGRYLGIERRTRSR